MSQEPFIIIGVLFWIAVLYLFINKMRNKERKYVLSYQQSNRPVTSAESAYLLKSVVTLAEKVTERVPVPTVVKRVQCEYCSVISAKDSGTCPSCGAPLP